MILAKCMTNGVMEFLGVFLVLLTVVNVADAATIEVRISGCDSFPNCYVTIGDAVTHAQPGDTVQVQPGHYEEPVVIDKDINLFGSGCGQTTIFAIGHGVTTTPNVTAEIRGFTITGTLSGILSNQPKNVIVRNNCVVSNQDGIGVVASGAPGTALLASNNVIGLNSRYGIICTNCNQATISAHNNIIFNNGTGTYFSCVSCGIDVRFNSFYGNTTNSFGIIIPIPSSLNISEDCQFIGSSSGNFVLQNASPCKDAGIDGPAYLDPDGSRNDLGAFGGPYAATFWPYPPGTPTITDIKLTPPTVQKGIPITINATAETR